MSILTCSCNACINFLASVCVNQKLFLVIFKTKLHTLIIQIYGAKHLNFASFFSLLHTDITIAFLIFLACSKL